MKSITTTNHKTLARFGRFMTLPVFVVLLASAPVHASKYGVRVVDDAGNPVAGAAVCIGLQGNYKQFGAMFTDSDGQAVTEVPNVPLIVTVSKTRFAGTRISEPARGFNLIKQVRLMEGVPGPRCRAGSSLVEANVPRITIKDIDVDAGLASTSLKPTVSGDPSHYRLSNTPDFNNASWQRFETAIALPDTLLRETSVFLQLRRYQGSRNGWLEARSEIVTVHLPQAR